jgi:hypothetical protein
VPLRSAAVGGAASHLRRDLRAVLDTLEALRNTALLSAQEAKGRLREIVEGFFFGRLKNNAGKRIERLLVKSPAGLGETREAIEWAVAYQSGRPARTELVCRSATSTRPSFRRKPPP